MKSKLLIINIILFSLLVLGSVSVFVAQTRNQTNTNANDLKLTYKTTVGSAGGSGQNIETVTMIKGARQRSETHTGYGYDTVTVTQCDLKRTIQISDTAKKYLITPMDEPGSSRTANSEAPVSSTPTRKGGTVDYVTSAIDTGERKDMFGFTARHVKSSITIDAAPDSCNPGKRRIELDGWYIDLNVAFNCDTNNPPEMPTRKPAGGGCKDQIRTRREGTAKTGFPLVETTKMYGDNGQLTVSQTKEVVELSRATLDTALFDIPAGYTEAASSSELYGAPSMASIMAGVNQGQTGRASVPSTPSTVESQKRPGSLLIGVAQFNNKAGRPISLDELRQRLIGNITGAGFDAVPLNAMSQMEAEVEAKVKQCDFILYTDIAALKMNKLGSVFGGITGTPGVAKTEAKLEFKLFAVGESAPRLQSSASAKEEGDEKSAATALDAEARAVVAEVRKKRG